MTTINLNGEGTPEPAKSRSKETARGWIAAMYVAGLGAVMLLGEAAGWLVPYLAGAGKGLSFLAAMLCAAMATIAYVAGFRYLVDYHNQN